MSETTAKDKVVLFKFIDYILTENLPSSDVEA